MDYSDLCGARNSVLLFGSATRPDDYSPHLSDINILVVGPGMIINNPRYSVMQYDEDTLMNRCLYGDPLCIWLIKDSRVLCGNPPSLKYIPTTWTLDSIKQLILNNIALMYENLIIGNRLWALNNAYHAVKLGIIRELVNPINLSDRALMEQAGGSYGELLGKLHDMRVKGIGIGDEVADNVTILMGRLLGIKLPAIGDVRDKVSGNPYATIQCDNYGCMVFRSDEEPWDYYYI